MNKIKIIDHRLGSLQMNPSVTPIYTDCAVRDTTHIEIEGEKIVVITLVDAPRFFFYLPAADDWRRPPSGPRKTFPTP